VAKIRVGESPQSVVIAGGRAWVTVDARTIPPPTSAARGGGTARLVMRDDVDYMDPALAYYGPSWQLLYATCAKLLNYPDKAGAAGTQLVPEVAQSLPARSADGRTYTFTIRPGFRFSPPSNEAVTAQTFKDAIERTLNRRMHMPVAHEFDDIVGATAYMTGRAAHISGVIARRNTLTVRLTAPAPDILARLAQPFFCAVPSNTPLDPRGVRVTPSAGPYRVASYAPGQGVVLTRNPNYHGDRPRRLARIELTVDVPAWRAISEVQAGTADYALDGEVGRDDAQALAARYGPRSPAARNGRQQYFVEPQRTLDFFDLNTRRRPFADVRLRRAVNYAIDRGALTRLGGLGLPLPARPIDHYLPPGIPGRPDLHIYPDHPDLAAARGLARGHAGQTIVLYTCHQPTCEEQAQVVKTKLAAIGLRVAIRPMAVDTLFSRILRPGEPFDMASIGWLSDYADPDAYLNVLLESGTRIPSFHDPHYRRRLAAAARLTGATRYLTYARLDADLARNAAPWVALATRPAMSCSRRGRAARPTGSTTPISARSARGPAGKRASPARGHGDLKRPTPGRAARRAAPAAARLRRRAPGDHAPRRARAHRDATRRRRRKQRSSRCLPAA
jgi:peptide/nickel transport system substrate-binding protein